MSKDKSATPDQTAPLTPEDDALWKRVAESAKPLRKTQNRRVELKPPPTPAPAPPRAKNKPAKAPPPHTPPPAPKPKQPPPVAPFERREARKLAAGRVSVDARIDLHGMRQHEAISALKAFLVRAQASGYRHVLVITGKGGKRESDGTFERGVLNREVPRWLAAPEFRQWVVSFSSAHKRHGGEGALYVRLRRDKSG